MNQFESVRKLQVFSRLRNFRLNSGQIVQMNPDITIEEDHVKLKCALLVEFEGVYSNLRFKVQTDLSANEKIFYMKKTVQLFNLIVLHWLRQGGLDEQVHEYLAERFRHSACDFRPKPSAEISGGPSSQPKNEEHLNYIEQCYQYLVVLENFFLVFHVSKTGRSLRLKTAATQPFSELLSKKQLLDGFIYDQNARRRETSRLARSFENTRYEITIASTGSDNRQSRCRTSLFVQER